MTKYVCKISLGIFKRLRRKLQIRVGLYFLLQYRACRLQCVAHVDSAAYVFGFYSAA